MIKISRLYSYPIKSCGGLSHERMTLDTNGPHYDRHWVITEPDGTFITQRKYPKMATIQPFFEDETLVVSRPGMPNLHISLHEREAALRAPVTVWRDTVEAADEGDEAAAWFSEVLEKDVRLWHMPPSTVRPVDPNYNNGEAAQVGFADGYPLLLLSEASLHELNRRLAEERGAEPLTFASFRPNVVVSGVEAPHAEDDFGRFTMGEIPFDAVKHCARCAVTTVDPQTGEIPNPKEPLATLALYRNGANGVLFGENVIHRATGEIAVGDAVVLG